ncbi:MAG: hypothetical protein AAF267_03540 [Deinococcota bacterium]
MQPLPTKPSINAQERIDRQFQLMLTLLAVVSVALSMFAAGLSWEWLVTMPVFVIVAVESRPSLALFAFVITMLLIWLGFFLISRASQRIFEQLSYQELTPKWSSRNPSKALLIGFTCLVVCYSLLYGLLLIPVIHHAKTVLHVPSASEVHIFLIALVSLILSPIVFLVSRGVTVYLLKARFPLLASAVVQAATGLAFIGLSMSPSPVSAIPMWLYHSRLMERLIAVF